MKTKWTSFVTASILITTAGALYYRNASYRAKDASIIPSGNQSLRDVPASSDENFSKDLDNVQNSVQETQGQNGQSPAGTITASPGSGNPKILLDCSQNGDSPFGEPGFDDLTILVSKTGHTIAVLTVYPGISANGGGPEIQHYLIQQGAPPEYEGKDGVTGYYGKGFGLSMPLVPMSPAGLQSSLTAEIGGTKVNYKIICNAL